MAILPTSRYWRRVDTIGGDHALFDDRRGLHARGVALAADPVPHTCRYELLTDETWTTAHLEVTAEGAGWLRTVRLERAAGQWRVTTAEQGDLDAALGAAGRPTYVGRPPGTEEPERLVDAFDAYLASAPLSSTLPLRRLDLLSAPAGTSRTITVAFVMVPSLKVLPVEQVYTVLGPNRVRDQQGEHAFDVVLDPDGYVIHAPGLADQVPNSRNPSTVER